VLNTGYSLIFINSNVLETRIIVLDAIPWANKCIHQTSLWYILFIPC